MAAVAGNAVGVEALLENLSLAPTLLSARDARGDTALASAVRFGRGASVAALLQAGATTAGMQLPLGKTLLHVAAEAPVEQCDGDVVSQLCRLGVPVDAKESVSGRTACVPTTSHAALRAPHPAPRTPTPTPTPRTARGRLHEAAARNHVRYVTSLIEHGAPVQARDDRGCTALHLAAASGALGALKLLIGAGGDVEATEMHGHTVLHVASDAGQEHVVEFLIGGGGETPGIMRYARALGGGVRSVRPPSRTSGLWDRPLSSRSSRRGLG